MISTTKDKKTYTRNDALDDLAHLENLAHPKDEPSSPEKYVAHEVISGMPKENTCMPVMTGTPPIEISTGDNFIISRPEAVKALMEILDVTIGDKVRILESLVLMYTGDDE